MRIDSDAARPKAAPASAPSLPAARGASESPRPKAEPSLVPIPADRVDRAQSNGGQRSDGLSALADWAKDEWSTVAGAAHGLASVPGVVSKGWRDAAQTNTNLANTIRSTVDHWGAEPAAVRQTAIDGLHKAAAAVSKTATTVANDLGAANRLPLDTLPASVEASARAAAHTLDLAAAAQSAKASTGIASWSASIGQTAKDLEGRVAGARGAASLLEKVPALADTPVFGLALTAGATANDIHAGKSVADAALANVGGTIAGTMAGAAVAEGLTATLDAAAIADGTATALGAAAAAGPVGWAVAGGVIASVAVGYGVYKAVESKAGQDIIDGATHLDRSKVQTGLGEARSDIVDAATKGGNWIASTVARLQL